ncbi:unnamed protein product [Aureobasidium pullulans]|nr:unnamed protein product [Aureobasidium pullulans]
MKVTAIALATMAAVATAAPTAEPAAAPEPAFSSWGKKYKPGMWNGWGDAPGQVYRREADPAFSSWGKKYKPGMWNGWGDAPGQVYRREAEADPAFSSWGKNTTLVSGTDGVMLPDRSTAVRPRPTLLSLRGARSTTLVYRREAEADPAFSSWGKKYHPGIWNGWGDAPGQVYRREPEATTTEAVVEPTETETAEVKA